MTTALTLHEDTALAMAGDVANQIAAAYVLIDYRSRKASNTLRAQDADLDNFAVYLSEAGVQAGQLATDVHAWQGITWGLVAGFVQWQLQRGYTTASINRALSTVKQYAKLATQAGILTPADLALIKTVSGYGHKEAQRVNERRETTRKGEKKAIAVSISKEQAQALMMDQPSTPQGRRDALLMCLLLDHGLRVGELALLQVEDVDMKAGTLTFYRPKVDKIQTHKLTLNTYSALVAYFQLNEPSYILHDVPKHGPLLLGSRKSGQLDGQMSVRAINERVGVLGRAVGLENLSPHDCRHYWATVATRAGTHVKALQDAGGWNSPAMPLRYAESAKSANEGVRLD